MFDKKEDNNEYLNEDLYTNQNKSFDKIDFQDKEESKNVRNVPNISLPKGGGNVQLQYI